MNDGSGGGGRVLLVDDDGVCLAMLARGLRRRGFSVTSFGDPVAALEQLAEVRPDAVVTDMRMPHMNGLDVLREVKARLGDGAPPVLVVSADGDEHQLLEAFRLGAVDYLLKPVSEVELGVKLARALRARPRADVAAIPARIAGWRLRACIGRGGTACVFDAAREGAPDARFALKVVWPHLTGNTEAMLRFRREIDTLLTLEHPRLVRFVESGREGDLFYYVMEHVSDGTLRDRIEARGPRPLLEVLELVEQLAEPLGYLHERGIVHRDVKPGNILFSAAGPVLGDFGLARRLLDHGITLSDEFIGTPLYLAPEVFRTREFDQSVDLYALGVCAFEALLGRPPLHEPDSIRLIGEIMEAGLPRPRDLIEGLPDAVERLLARMLAFEPRDRFASAGALRAAAREVRLALSAVRDRPGRTNEVASP